MVVKYEEFKPHHDSSWSALVPSFSGRLVKVRDSKLGALEGRLKVIKKSYNYLYCYQLCLEDGEKRVLCYDDIERFEVNVDEEELRE